MADSPTIIVGHLNDKELTDSISKLVATVKQQTEQMANDFDKSIDRMLAKLRELGKFKFDNTAVKSGSSKNTTTSGRDESVTNIQQITQATKQQAVAAKEVTMTYDQMQATLQKIARDNSGLKATFNQQELQSYIDLLRKLQAEYIKVNTQEGGGTKSDKIKREIEELNLIIQKYQAILANIDMVNSRQGTIDVKKWVQDLGAVDDRYNKLTRWYQVLEKEDQRRIATEEKNNQKRLAQIEKERQAQQKVIEQYQNSVLKTEFSKVMKMPIGDVDQMQAKLQRLQTILATTREMGILSPTQIASAETEIKKLRTNIQSVGDTAKQTGQVVEQAFQPKSARDSFYAFVQGYKQQISSLTQQIKAEEASIAAGLSSDIAKAKGMISGLFADITNLRKTQPTGYRDTIKERLASVDVLNEKIRQLSLSLQSVEKGDFTSNSTAKLQDLQKKLAELVTLYDELTKRQQGSAESTRQETQVAQQYTDEIKRQAQAIRESNEWKAKGKAYYNYDASIGDVQKSGTRIITAQSELSIEEQILQVHKEIAVAREKYEREQQQQLAQTQQQLDTEKQITQEYVAREKINYYKAPAVKEGAYARMLSRVLGTEKENIKTNARDIEDASKYVKQLETAYRKLTATEKNSPFGKSVKEELFLARTELRRLQSEMNRPLSLNIIKGMSEKTIDDIAFKIQQLQTYKRGINVTDSKQTGELRQVDEEINRLTKDLNKYMATTRQASASNNALTRSWNYMKNRLAFYFTVGASTQFVKNLIDIRSQYEMNERALGILINSAERGTQIFNELSQMALVSPYTLIELSSAAKQLTAYDIAARDVVDTTRRLADMAAAVGIPMERLTYALGQIKAYGYLNARDARMFANAGIPLVKQLSDYYTELEGRMVSTADVYDKIKKKAIDFNTVMDVITKMTDEGGKFFDFQAKMADTLKVRLANLTLAWNNMLNDIGKESQGVLTWGIGALRDLFLHWKDLDKLIKDTAWVLGMVTAVKLWGYAAMKTGFWIGNLNKNMTLNSVLGTRLAGVARTLWHSLGALATNPFTWITVALVGISQMVESLSNLNSVTKEFNKTLRESAKNNYDEVAKFLEQYKDARDSLYKTVEKQVPKGKINLQEWTDSQGNKRHNVSSFYDEIVPRDIEDSEAKKLWESVREQIELATNNSDKYISRLMTISNMSERVRQGFAALEDIKVVYSALKEVDDETIKVTKNISAWWNAWQAPDGLIGNLNDLQEELDKLTEKYGNVANAEKQARGTNEAWKDYGDYSEALERFQKDLAETTKSIDAYIGRMGWAGDSGKITEVYSQVTNKLIQDNQLSPEKAFTLQLEVENARAAAAKQSLIIRYKDEKKALLAATDEYAKIEIQSRIDALSQEYDAFEKNNGRGKVLWENYTKWMKERHMSEMREMFRGMTAEKISKINFSEEKWRTFAETTANTFAREHNLATNDVFTLLRDWVKDANKWSIFIPLTISSEGGKSAIDTLKEADSQLDTSLANIERLKRRQKELLEKGGATSKDLEVASQYLKVTKEIEEEEKSAEFARSKGGHSKQEDKDAKQAAKDAERERKKQQREAAKAQREAETELQKAFKDELQLIDKVRSQYKKLTDAGVTGTTALNMVTNQFGNTIRQINKILGKNGLPLFNIKTFAGTDNPNMILDMLDRQLRVAKTSKNVKPSEIKDLEVKVSELTIDAKVYNTKKIVTGLNNELSKLKDEYELSIELDANPELGDIFSDIFGLNTKELPKSFSEALERANGIIESRMRDLKVFLLDFDLLGDTITPDEKNMWMGLDFDSDVVKELVKWQNNFRDMFKKNITETEKMLDDYVKKYGDYSDKIAEIEADRLTKLGKLNEAYYTEEMRKRPEYIAKLKAIEQGAQREKGQAKFDEFKESRLYVAMFENLQYVSTATLTAMRDKLEQLKKELGSLSPEQLKQVTQQFEKIDQEIRNRNPFKGLVGGIKDYAKAMGKQGKQAQKDFIAAQRKYDWQVQIVASLKEELEQKKRQNPLDEGRIEALKVEIQSEEDKLAKLKEELEIAEMLNEKYNMMRKLFGEQSKAIAKLAQVISSNLQSLGELRDTIQTTFDVDLGDSINAVVDDLQKVGEGINGIVSSAQSGNVVGVVNGTINTIAGIGDAFASIFGGGAAKTKRINREIQESVESVRLLNLAYKDLERAVEKSLGTAETEARRAAIANKEAELAEIERQLVLEQSKRSKDRDDDSIKQYQEKIHDLRNEISDLKDDVINNLLGSDVKSAAESFVDAWVDAWREGETTLDAINEKMDEMIMNLIKKAASSAIVSKIIKPLYDAVDKYTSEDSEGGVALTANEIVALANLSKQLGIDINEALTAFYGNLEGLGAVTKSIESENELSALQAGIQGITEDTAGALEAYMNSVSQQVYLHSELLTQIRDAVVMMNLDVEVATISQILLQLQASYQVQMSIQSTLDGWSNANGQAVRVELLN